jgi:hypothetical protein
MKEFRIEIQPLLVDGSMFALAPVVAELEVTPQCRDADGEELQNPVAEIVQTYRNHAGLVPGKTVWLCLARHSGRLLAESLESLEDAVAKVHNRIRLQGGVL